MTHKYQNILINQCVTTMRDVNIFLVKLGVKNNKIIQNITKSEKPIS